MIDSTRVTEIEEVVITGQHNPQSIEKSVFEVKVISRATIEQQAANNLADLLNQTLNINITPNTSTGKSGVSLFGLDAQYFKVLIDNVPVINEEGVGNNTDLTLINLDDILQIEIVEGAMGVQYGSNAVSGVINIITKKSVSEKTNINVYIQEETVGDEYEWFDKGRHIQALQISHNLDETLMGSIAYTRNDFAGFYGTQQGAMYDQNDGLRGHTWLPKEQQNAKLLLNFKKDAFKAFYKFDYFNETIQEYNTVVDLNENAATDTTDPLALDALYTNNRFVHHLNVDGNIKDRVNYNISVSYQEQNKDIETYTYRIRRDQKLNKQEGEYLSRSAFFSRGTFSNLIDKKTFNLQAGYELTNEKGFGSPLAITINPDENNIQQRLNNYDFFTSSEITISDQFSIRPGARVSFTNLFDHQYVFSFSSRYSFRNKIELRTIIGSANRTPSYDELYTYFVDVNHDVQGNPNLDPEKGISAFLHLKKKYKVSKNLQLQNKISASYLDVKDRIELIVVEQTPLSFQYNNIDTYKAIGLFSENTLQYDRLKIQAGVSFLGISKILNSDINANDDFLYSFQLNTAIGYSIPDWKTTFSLFLKHIGKQHQFVEKTNAQGAQEFVKGTTDAYSWMDATIKKSFFKDKIETTFGIRNLLDITEVNTSAFSGGAHNGPPTGLTLGYGRSYFLKIAYHLNL
ncbi:TonB-dependent receptor [Aquimarina addita]|uniref:TonB-dependent receptor n=1 Tax=Aquimarina addita TaxID=870485 RepID=A0ABP6USB4_9FLAO